MSDTPLPTSSRWRFQTAMILAVAADALQVFVLPLFAEGALSTADDLLDLGVAARKAESRDGGRIRDTRCSRMYRTR